MQSGKTGIAAMALAICGSTSALCETQTYEYDALGRLRTAYHRNGPAEGHLITITNDSADNRQVFSDYNVLITLNTGQSITSPDGRFLLAMQTDGNLVLYQINVAALWATNTTGSNIVAKFQADGNLVLYTPAGVSIWQSGTGGNWASKLFVQDDGNLVIYNKDSAGIWASNTGGH